MTKSTVTKLFVGSLIAIMGGIFLMALGGLLALSGTTLVTSSGEVTGVHFNASAPQMLSLVLAGLMIVIAGGVTQFVAWLGALMNTSRLEDKTWFILLLVLGLLSFGLIAMLVYVVAGPDGMEIPATGRHPSPGAA